LFANELKFSATVHFYICNFLLHGLSKAPFNGEFFFFMFYF
jgi:hypothetical protein